MSFDFDRFTDRRNSSSLKWRTYGEEILPLWVADMDFPSPEPIQKVLRNCLNYGIYGYSIDLPELMEIICSRIRDQQGWIVEESDIVLLPGLVPGLNLASKALAEPGQSVLVNSPVYPPFLTAPINQGRTLQCSPQAVRNQERQLYYEIDFQDFRNAITKQTGLFILCNPHNPTGRVFSKSELLELAEICEENQILICSDEIHCDLILDPGKSHVSIAALDPKIADRTVTLIAPSKTFNLPGLGCSIAIITNPELRMRFKKAARGIIPQPNFLGMYAALAAYKECEDWRKELISYLQANRQLVTDFVSERLQGMEATHPEATYLTWMDCRNLELKMEPGQFFLEKAKVALNNGKDFGPGGEGFVRLNFGCSRSTLEQALERMETALAER